MTSKTPKNSADALFVFLILAGFVAIAMAAGIAMSHGCLTGCGLVILLLFPVAAVFLIRGAVVAHVWRDRRFWLAFASASAVAWIVFGRPASWDELDVATAIFAVTFAAIVAYLVWQIIVWTGPFRARFSAGPPR